MISFACHFPFTVTFSMSDLSITEQLISLSPIEAIFIVCIGRITRSYEMDESTGSLLKALRFSAEKHSDQRRKDARASPYINHPIQVVEILWTIGDVRDV